MRTATKPGSLSRPDVAMIAAALVVLADLAVVPAFANQWPASVVGTWAGFVDQAPVSIVIATQAAAGESCKALSGSFAGGRLDGIYCPSDGRFSLVRYCGASGPVAQVYVGNVADGVAAHRAAGIVANVTACYGAAGDGSFWMRK